MKRIYTAVALPLVLGLLLTSTNLQANPEANTYYADHISTCVDACGGLSERGCGCVKLPPIIIQG